MVTMAQALLNLVLSASILGGRLKLWSIFD